jgi:hypothetical protein
MECPIPQKKAEESIAESLYFLVLHSYLLQKPDLKDNYGVLLDHYNKYPESLLILTRNDLIRLKHIQNDIKNNSYTLLYGDINFSKYELPELKKEKSSLNHNTLCNNIINKQDLLGGIIGGTVDYVSREHPTFFGPIDIVAQHKDTVFIIEVKTYKTDHSIIGQVIKYYIALSLKLINRCYDDIKIITLCPGYDRASYIGLKQIGAKPMIINPNSLEIKEIEIKS